MAEIEVSAAHVYRTTQEFLDTRARTIAKKREELVTKAMRKRKYGFFGPKLTREEATHYVQNNGYFLSAWDEVSLCGANRASHIKALHDLAMLNPNGLMTLTHKDASVLPTLVPSTQRTE